MEKGCEEIMASIVDKTRNKPEMLICAFETLVIEWFGIDSIRLDKFMYFVRQLVRTLIELMEENPRSEILSTVLSTIQKCLGLILHVCDVFTEEMFKRSSELKFIVFCIRPFMDLIGNNADEELSKHIVKEVVLMVLETLEEQKSTQNVAEFKRSMTKILNNLLRKPNLKRSSRELIEKTGQVFHPEDDEVRKMKKRKRISSQVERDGLIYKRSKIPIAVDL